MLTTLKFENKEKILKYSVSSKVVFFLLLLFLFCRICVRDGSGALPIFHREAGTDSPTLVVTPKKY